MLHSDILFHMPMVIRKMKNQVRAILPIVHAIFFSLCGWTIMQINDFDDLWERFSILTIDGKLTDQKALDKLKERTTPELFNQLKQKVIEMSIG